MIFSGTRNIFSVFCYSLSIFLDSTVGASVGTTLAGDEATAVVVGGSVGGPDAVLGGEEPDGLHDETGEDDEVVVFGDNVVLDGTTVADVHGGLAVEVVVVVATPHDGGTAAGDVVVEAAGVEGVDGVGTGEDAVEHDGTGVFTLGDFDFFGGGDVAAGEFEVVLLEDNLAEVFGAGEAGSGVGAGAEAVADVLAAGAAELAGLAAVEDQGSVVEGPAFSGGFGGTTPAEPDVLAEVELAGVEGGDGAEGHLGLGGSVPLEGGFVTEAFTAEVLGEFTFVGGAGLAFLGGGGDLGGGAATEVEAEAGGEFDVNDGDGFTEHVAGDEVLLGRAAAEFELDGAGGEGFGHGTVHHVNPILDGVSGDFVVVAVLDGGLLGVFGDFFTVDVMDEHHVGGVPLLRGDVQPRALRGRREGDGGSRSVQTLTGSSHYCFVVDSIRKRKGNCVKDF